MTTALQSSSVPALVANAERAILVLLHGGHLLVEVERRAERLDLFHQAIHEVLRVAHRNGRNVVDGLVGVQLRALTAGLRQRVDDVRLQAKQAKLENLK